MLSFYVGGVKLAIVKNTVLLRVSNCFEVSIEYIMEVLIFK